MKKPLIWAIVIIIAVGGIFAWKFYSAKNNEIPNESGESYVPEVPSTLILVNLTIGDFYAEKTVAIADGATVLDLLETTSTNDKFTLLIEEGYVRGINGKNAEGNSGWVYEVNGESPRHAMKDYILKDGDKVKLSYVTL